MGLSLQEQLLKAGVVDKKQAKKADHERRVKNQKKRKGKGPPVDSDDLRRQQQQTERVKQDQKLNAERNQQVQQKADLAAAQQLIAANCLAVEEGTVSYHYVDVGGKIKRILVNQEVEEKLSTGKLGLAAHKGDIVLIPAESVVKVLNRAKNLIMSYNDPAQMDDEYPTDW